MAFLGLSLGGGNMPARKIAGPDVIGFALGDQNFKRAPQLIPGNIAVNMMHLVQLNMVGLQAFQRAFKMTSDLVCGQTGA
ncbi:hypothetical protein D3C84_1184940 [compost metagenome]